MPNHANTAHPTVFTTDRGETIQMLSGILLPIFDLRPDEIEIGDIAHSLAMQCRFNGHCRRFYSVAQHSVLVSRLVPDDLALWGLLHDAAEAYLGDIVKPLKIVLDRASGGFIKQAETRITEAVAQRFGLSWPEPAEIKAADMIALATEKRDLMANTRTPWAKLPEPHAGLIVPMAPHDAKTAFMARYAALTTTSAEGQANG